MLCLSVKIGESRRGLEELTPMRLDLRLLEIYCSVYSERSFSRAGERLLLAQPTISGHIKNLEDQLEVKFFNRLGR